MARHLPLIILSALLCITWVEGLRRYPPCDITKCKDVCKYQCPYGREKDVFSCCLRCMKGPGEECGGSYNFGGSCGGDLVCVGSNSRRQKGVCLPQVKCISTVRCDPASCKKPEGCKVGVGKNACSCCPTCLRNKGEPCGLRQVGRVPCGRGLECCGETSDHEGYCKPINLAENFSVCYKVKFCPYTKCAQYPSGCGERGWGMSPCGCCSGCLKSIGEKCGVKHFKYLPCSRGLICKGECTEHGYTPGTCVSPNAPSDPEKGSPSKPKKQSYSQDHSKNAHTISDHGEKWETSESHSTLTVQNSNDTSPPDHNIFEINDDGSKCNTGTHLSPNDPSKPAKQSYNEDHSKNSHTISGNGEKWETSESHSSVTVENSNNTSPPDNSVFEMSEAIFKANNEMFANDDFFKSNGKEISDYEFFHDPFFLDDHEFGKC